MSSVSASKIECKSLIALYIMSHGEHKTKLRLKLGQYTLLDKGMASVVLKLLFFRWSKSLSITGTHRAL